jgi:carbon monoxide dehydrogenase subunit G
MLLKGDMAIRVEQKQIWDFLTDPNQIGQCAWGVKKIEVAKLNKRSSQMISARLMGDGDGLSKAEPA